MTTSEPVPNQLVKLHKFLIAYQQVNGYAPSVRECADKMGIALSTAQRQLSMLEKSGHVKRSPGIPRGLVVVS